ncbi:MAG TPA: hypothetical protein VJV79_17290 [Polyangiaceae bacterium]|nr:hypothetical protein [Polyangiaceae bacterium]
MALHKDIIERANARLGSVLKGKWRLDALIGIGGMASVYAATHRNQARAAIKLLHPEVALDAEVTARFLREGYVANKLAHPGAVTVLDDDVSEDHAPSRATPALPNRATPPPIYSVVSAQPVS